MIGLSALGPAVHVVRGDAGPTLLSPCITTTSYDYDPATL